MLRQHAARVGVSFLRVCDNQMVVAMISNPFLPLPAKRTTWNNSSRVATRDDHIRIEN